MRVHLVLQPSALWVQGCDIDFRYFAQCIHPKKNPKRFFFAFLPIAIRTWFEEIKKETLAFIYQFYAVWPAKCLDQRLVVSSKEIVLDSL